MTKQPWPTDEDLRRELLFAAVMWGGISVAGIIVCVALLVRMAT